MRTDDRYKWMKVCSAVCLAVAAIAAILLLVFPSPSGFLGNPSGPIPVPPATDLNAPPDQLTYNTGGQPWEPLPSHPNITDPVIPDR